jgi:hypothetical protein
LKDYELLSGDPLPLHLIAVNEEGRKIRGVLNFRLLEMSSSMAKRKGVNSLGIDPSLIMSTAEM